MPYLSHVAKKGCPLVISTGDRTVALWCLMLIKRLPRNAKHGYHTPGVQHGEANQSQLYASSVHEHVSPATGGCPFACDIGRRAQHGKRRPFALGSRAKGVPPRPRLKGVPSPPSKGVPPPPPPRPQGVCPPPISLYKHKLEGIP